MTKLNQIIAIEKGVKAKTSREFTDLHRTIQKLPLLAGIARNYAPKDDDGDRLPPESTLVQVSADGVLADLTAVLVRLFDLEITKDTANGEAFADVEIGGATIVVDAPVTTLLFLEKQLVDVRTFIAKIPVLDPSERWTHDSATGVWVTDASVTAKNKKVPRNHVKAPATDKHPAQVELYYEDVIVGMWTTRKFSGALPADRQHVLLGRVDRLIDAVKYAREQANSKEIADYKMGKAIFDYLLAP